MKIARPQLSRFAGISLLIAAILSCQHQNHRATSKSTSTLHVGMAEAEVIEVLNANFDKVDRAIQTVAVVPNLCWKHKNSDLCLETNWADDKLIRLKYCRSDAYGRPKGSQEFSDVRSIVIDNSGRIVSSDLIKVIYY